MFKMHGNNKKKTIEVFEDILASFENKAFSAISAISIIGILGFHFFVVPELIRDGRPVLLFDLENILNITSARTVLRLAGLQWVIVLSIFNGLLLGIDRLLSTSKKKKRRN